MAETVSSVPAWALIVLGILSLLGIVIPALLTWDVRLHAKRGADSAAIGAEQATQTNDSVNHRHKIGEDRLFDMVVETRNQVRAINAWKDRWDGLPEHLSDAANLTTHLAVIEDRIKTSAQQVTERVDRLDESNSVAHDRIAATLTDHLRRAEPWLTEHEKGTP